MARLSKDEARSRRNGTYHRYRLARYLRETGTTIGGLDWGPWAVDLSEEERARVVLEFITSPGEDVTDEIF